MKRSSMIFSLLSCHFSLFVFVSKNFHLSRATTSSQKMGKEVVEAVGGEHQEGGEDCKNVHRIVRQRSCKRTLSWACLLFWMFSPRCLELTFKCSAPLVLATYSTNQTASSIGRVRRSFIRRDNEAIFFLYQGLSRT